jgi:hypothetical protein
MGHLIVMDLRRQMAVADATAIASARPGRGGRGADRPNLRRLGAGIAARHGMDARAVLVAAAT